MLNLGKAAFLALAIGLPAASAVAQPNQPDAQTMRSATKARDIGGFALGMHIHDVAKIAKVTPIGGNQFDTEHEGKSYNFEVTPLGRIFRVQSSQPLGRFAVDTAFTNALAAKLAAKYGPPKSGDFGSYYWQTVEPVKHSDGTTLPFTTMWMSAYVSDGSGVTDVSLEMKMIDFRILWQDEAKLNRAPRDKAVEGVAL